MTEFNYANLDPARREHFVYRAFNRHGHLLYVGCTMDLDRRRKEHSGKTGSRWWKRAVRFTVSGPYNYDTARGIERQAIRSEGPIWNYCEPRRSRIRALQRRVDDHAFSTTYERTADMGLALDALEGVRNVIPSPDGGRPLTALDVARAEKAYRVHMERSGLAPSSSTAGALSPSADAGRGSHQGEGVRA